MRCELNVLCVEHVLAVTWVASVMCMGANFVMYRLFVLCVGHVLAVTWVASRCTRCLCCMLVKSLL